MRGCGEARRTARTWCALIMSPAGEVAVDLGGRAIWSRSSRSCDARVLALAKGRSRKSFAGRFKVAVEDAVAAHRSVLPADRRIAGATIVGGTARKWLAIGAEMAGGALRAGTSRTFWWSRATRPRRRLGGSSNARDRPRQGGRMGDERANWDHWSGNRKWESWASLRSPSRLRCGRR